MNKNTPPKFWLFVAGYLDHKRGKCSCLLLLQVKSISSPSSVCRLYPFATLDNGEFSLFWLTFITNLYRNLINSCYFSWLFSVQDIKTVLSFSQTLSHELPHSSVAAGLQSTQGCALSVVATPRTEGLASCLEGWKLQTQQMLANLRWL